MACATLKRSFEFDPVLSPQHQPTPKRRRCTPLTTSSSQSCSVSQDSPFLEVTPRLSQDQLTTSINLEWKRIQRRKHIRPPCPSSPEGASSFWSHSPSSSPSRKEQPLFTLKQVTHICERMLKERETQLQEEYDKVLSTKLAEQYDAFVKFSYDQVQRRFDGVAPTYVS